jgi:hypothetical protein
MISPCDSRISPPQAISLGACALLWHCRQPHYFLLLVAKARFPCLSKVSPNLLLRAVARPYIFRAKPIRRADFIGFPQKTYFTLR